MEKIPMKNSAINVIANKKAAQEKGVKDPYIESRFKDKESKKTPEYKKSSGAMSFKEWGDKNPVKKAIVQLVDPTGVSSYGDVKKTWNDKKIDRNDFIETLGALPVVGKIPKIVTSGLKLSKGITASMRIANTAQKINNVTSKTNKVAKTASRAQAAETVASKLIKKK